MAAGTPGTGARIRGFGFSQWRSIGRTLAIRLFHDDIMLVASGLSYYGFLTLLPMLGALAMLYGLVASPEDVLAVIRKLVRIMPTDAAALVGAEMLHLIDSSDTRKGTGLAVALAVSLFGARGGATAVITGLNVAYEEQEKRSFLTVNVLAMAMAAVALALALASAVTMAGLAWLQALVPDDSPWLAWPWRVVSALVVLAAGTLSAWLLYRFAPSHSMGTVRRFAPGAVLAAASWMLVNMGFGAYVRTIGDYGATYGALASVVVLLTWMYLSGLVLLVGAEFNAVVDSSASECAPG